MGYRPYYTGLRGRDLAQSLALYLGSLGRRVVADGTMPHGVRYIHPKSPGAAQRLGLNGCPPGSRFCTPYCTRRALDHLAFRVDDVGASSGALVAPRAKPAVKPSEAEGTEAYIEEPDVIWLELLA